LSVHQLALTRDHCTSLLLVAQAHEQWRLLQAHKESTRVDGWEQQHEDGINASDASSSQPPPPPSPRAHRFLVSKKLHPTLLGNQPLPSTVPQPAELSSGATAALQLPLVVVADAAPSSARSRIVCILSSAASAVAESSG
jgi:hypothetical protein